MTLENREKISVEIVHDPSQASNSVATEIASLIRKFANEGKNCVLGLAEYEAIEAFVQWSSIETGKFVVIKRVYV